MIQCKFLIDNKDCKITNCIPSLNLLSNKTKQKQKSHFLWIFLHINIYTECSKSEIIVMQIHQTH